MKIFLTLLGIALLLFSGEMSAQIIRGTVRDNKGETLIGVVVSIKNTSIGVVTDTDGNYEIKAAGSETLVFSYMGYNAQEEYIKNRTVIDIVLQDKEIDLGEVVVVGYGKTSSKDISSSIASLSEKDFNKGAVTSVAQMIQGRVAGVSIVKDGDPNSAGTIIIRGTSTLREGGQGPLYVIDGVPSIGIVSPQDIVTIDILRDASATAIYGSRAANGVIMITTRQGRKGDQKYITASTDMSIEQVSKRYEMMNGDQYRKYLSDNGAVVLTGWDDGENSNWQDQVLRTAILQNYYFNIGGTSNKTAYDASVNYLKRDGIIKTTGQDKMVMRANVETPFANDKITVGMTLNGMLNNQNLLADANGVYKSMLTFLPTTNAMTANGIYKEDPLFNGMDANPLGLLNQNTKKATIKTMLGSLRARWNIIDNVSYNATLSYENNQTNTNTYYGKYSRIGIAQQQNGLAIRSAYENTKTIFENYLTYNKEIGKHKFDIMGGYSWQENKDNDGFQTSTVNFISDATGYYNLSLGNPPSGYQVNWGTPTIRTLRMISFFGRLNYNYQQRYILQASLRKDGSSAFGKNNRWGMFPSVSGAWRIISEDFMKDQHLFSDLKLKAGYGISGNSFGFDPMTSLIRYGATGNAYYNGGYITSIGAISNPNPDLKWEKTSMFNLGLSTSFAEGRFSMGVEWYNKKTSDLIWTYNVPSTTYIYETIDANVGKISNKGIEVTLGADILRNSNGVTWNTGFIFSHNKNRVESLSNDLFKIDYKKVAGDLGASQTGGTAQIIKEGYPLGTFYTLKFQGFNDQGKSTFLDKDGNITDAPVQDDYYICGNSQPKLIYSWTNSVSWKNFSLDVLLNGVAGRKVMNVTLAKLNYSKSIDKANQPIYILDSNQPFGDVNSQLVSDRYIEKADYLRISDINLNYRMPIASNNYVKEVNLYFHVSNAYTFTSYKGIDPEVGMSGITPGVDNNNMYPNTRSFQLGAKINF